MSALRDASIMIRSLPVRVPSSVIIPAVTETGPTPSTPEFFLLNLIPKQWWKPLHKEVLNTAWFWELSRWIHYEYQEKDILPRASNLFNFLKWTNVYHGTAVSDIGPFTPPTVDCPPEVMVQGALARRSFHPPGLLRELPSDAPPPRIVIVGASPYHLTGTPLSSSAIPYPREYGYAYGVAPDLPPTNELVNIYRELSRSSRGTFVPPKHGCLVGWARQGVVLINELLTVVNGNLHCDDHRGIGWERFTAAVLRSISNSSNNVVFMLWGRSAVKYAAGIDASRHLVLKCTHPGPHTAFHEDKEGCLAAFYGSDHFALADAYMQQHGQTAVDWNDLWHPAWRCTEIERFDKPTLRTMRKFNSMVARA